MATVVAGVVNWNVEAVCKHPVDLAVTDEMVAYPASQHIVGVKIVGRVGIVQAGSLKRLIRLKDVSRIVDSPRRLTKF